MTPSLRSETGACRAGAARALLAVVLLAAFGAACGKKGPPLAPLVRLPAAADAVTAQRLGSTVYVQFTVPSKNQDNSTPADIAHVDVYGFTGTPESDDEIVKYGTLVASVPVRRPPTPEEEDRARQKQAQEQATPQKEQGAGKGTTRAPEPEPGVDQGATVTVTETLTAAVLQPAAVTRRVRKPTKDAAAGEGPILLPSASAALVPARVYAAVGVSRNGHRGAFSRHASIPVLDVPPPPTGVKLAHTETAITIQWTPPPGAPAPPEPAGATAANPDAVPPLPSKPIVPLGGPEWSYQVYDVPAPARQPAVTASSAGTPPAMPPVTVPKPLNPQPLTAPAFSDANIEFGTERCYVVRAVETFGALREESEPSDVACITPRDIYPPAAPKGLTAVVNAGTVSLIWDANSESDLDGYLVLRADAPNGTLQAIIREPIHDTTFNDTSVKPGVRYIYAIVAVDKAGNASAQSARIEETAR